MKVKLNELYTDRGLTSLPQTIGIHSWNKPAWFERNLINIQCVCVYCRFLFVVCVYLLNSGSVSDSNMCACYTCSLLSLAL